MTDSDDTADDPGPYDTVRFGISVQRRLRDKLDEYVQAREERTGENVSRSEVAAMCLEVGLRANRLLDDKFEKPQTARSRVGQTGSALSRYEAEHFENTDVMVDALAEAEDVDPDELRDCILRLQLDE